MRIRRCVSLLYDVYVCLYVCVCLYICVCLYVCVCLYICVYVSVCVSVSLLSVCLSTLHLWLQSRFCVLSAHSHRYTRMKGFQERFRIIKHYGLCLSFCLFVCRCVGLSICPSVCLSISLSVHPSVHLSICPSVCLSIRPPVCPISKYTTLLFVRVSLLCH